MVKHQWGELRKSSGGHIDPEKVEQLKRTKTEIEHHMTKILKLVKNENQGRKSGTDPKNESELVGLIEDFYKQQQSLYAIFDHLGGESGKVDYGGKQNEAHWLSSSSSDSNYYSSEAKLENEHQELEEGIKQTLQTAKFEVSNLKHKLASINEEKKALKSEYFAALSKIQEAEIINKSLRIEMDERERELLALIKVDEVHGTQSIDLKNEVESLLGQKRDMEAWNESKATEAKKLKEKNIGLNTRILELELLLKNKGNEVSSLLKKLKDSESYSTSKIAELMAQASSLQHEVNSLCAQKVEMEERMLCRNEALDQVTEMQLELESLHSQKTKSERKVERKTKEISQYLIHIKTQSDELAKRTMVEQRMLEEKEGFIIQVEDLKNQKKELEEKYKSKILETNRLREEKEELHARNLELEKALTERGYELFALQEKYESKENEASTQVMTLAAQINNMQHNLDSLQTKKSQLELQIESEKQESFMKKQESTTVSKVSGEYKQTKGWLQKNKLNPQIVERKMKKLAEEFQNNLEDKIRLLCQRILVAEHLHAENKDSYRMTKEWYEAEIRVLEEKIATYEAEVRKLKDILETENNAWSGSDLVETENNVFDRITNMSNELQFAKDWVTRTNNELKRLRQNEDCLVAQLDDKEEQEFLLREKVWMLEAKVSKEGGEKLNFMKAKSQLEKKLAKLEKNIEDKDEELLSLGEEKREAIRQLCVLIDYHRSRFDHVKEVMSKMTHKRT